jgi:hypothetical protein
MALCPQSGRDEDAIAALASGGTILSEGEMDMATAPARPLSTADELLEAVKRLPPAELHEFQHQFTAWSGQKNGRNGASSPEQDEAALLSAIQENSTLSPADQRRFNRLRRKRQTGKLTAQEERRLQELWRCVEQMNAARLEALAELARRRGSDVKTLMQQLGLSENRDVF